VLAALRSIMLLAAARQLLGQYDCIVVAV
jgi:hypothetical protein